MQPRLLITDDALIIREMIKASATEAGWDVVGEASNGQEAVEKFATLMPDAMTLDLVMPDFGGLQVLEHLREHNLRAYIIVVSAIEQTSVIKEALRLGASDFVVKPFNATRLTDTLRKAAALFPQSVGSFSI